MWFYFTTVKGPDNVKGVVKLLKHKIGLIRKSSFKASLLCHHLLVGNILNHMDCAVKEGTYPITIDS